MVDDDDDDDDAATGDGPGERVDLWLVDEARTRAPDLLASYRELLCADEHARLRRLRFEEGRRRFLVTRALCRIGLSRYAAVDPRDWRFRTNRHGRPLVEAPAPLPDGLDFNLSHTPGVIALLVGAGHEIGVDVEDTERRGKTVEIAERFFSPGEVAALRALPAEQRRRRFFEYWTLKEAYIKARGMGLALPLRLFSFDLDADAAKGPRIAFEPEIDDDAETWQFATFELSDHHLLSVALRRVAGAEREVRVRWTVPTIGHDAGR